MSTLPPYPPKGAGAVSADLFGGGDFQSNLSTYVERRFTYLLPIERDAYSCIVDQRKIIYLIIVGTAFYEPVAGMPGEIVF